MKEVEIHQRENNSDTESFLQENIGKFQTDAVFLLGVMIRGEVLTAKTVVQKYDKEPRRLRDLEISGKCQKRWVLKENGKRSHVEYFVPVHRIPTKIELIQTAEKAIENLKTVERNLVTVFELDENPPHYSQGNLFNL